MRRPPAERAPSPTNRRGIVNSAKGMTLIEVVVILVLLGVMALAVTSRMTSGTADLVATTDGISSQLRLVQTIAMNSSTGLWGLRFESAGQTYHMFHCLDASDCDMDRDALPLPGVDTDSNDRVAVSEGGNIQLQANSNVAYDSFGRPYRITGSSAVVAVDEITISFRDGAGNTNAIQITPKTGFIP